MGKQMKEFISCDSRICRGSPCIVGHRLTVYNVVSSLYLESDITVLYEDFELTKQQLVAALNYCLELRCTIDDTLINYCDGCILGESSENEVVAGNLSLFRANRDKNYLENCIESVEYPDIELMIGWELAEWIVKRDRTYD